MNGTSRMFTVLAVAVGAWIITYWLYEPSAEPHVSVDMRPASRDRPSIIPQAPLASTALSPEPVVSPSDSGTIVQRAETTLTVPGPADPGARAGLQPRVEPRPRVIEPRFRDAVVQRGDTSWQRVARRELGDEKRWPAIARANPFVTSDRLVPGKTVLKIPLDPDNIQGIALPPEDAAGAAPGAAQAAPAASEPELRAHTIQQDDTLWSISKKYYGRGGQWKIIYDANRDVIPDPDRPPIGVSIKIPPQPRG